MANKIEIKISPAMIADAVAALRQFEHLFSLGPSSEEMVAEAVATAILPHVLGASLKTRTFSR